MASAVRGMSAVCRNESTGPCERRVVCTVLPHITASVLINGEYGLHQDRERWLEELAPHPPVSQYQHLAPVKLASGKPLSRGNRTNNADVHLERTAQTSRTSAAENGCTSAAQGGCTAQIMGRDAQRWSQ